MKPEPRLTFVYFSRQASALPKHFQILCNRSSVYISVYIGFVDVIGHFRPRSGWASAKSRDITSSKTYLGSREVCNSLEHLKSEAVKV